MHLMHRVVRCGAVRSSWLLTQSSQGAASRPRYRLANGRTRTASFGIADSLRWPRLPLLCWVGDVQRGGMGIRA